MYVIGCNMTQFAGYIRLSVRIVDKCQLPPVIVHENVDEVLDQRVKVRTHACHSAVHGVLSEAEISRQTPSCDHRYVPVPNL